MSGGGQTDLAIYFRKCANTGLYTRKLFFFTSNRKLIKKRLHLIQIEIMYKNRIRNDINIDFTQVLPLSTY